TTNKTRLSRIGGERRSRQPSADALPVSAPWGFACTGRTIGGSLCTARKRAPTTPSTDEQRKAPRHPTAPCRNRSVTGALAGPIMPEQLWNEKTWVVRRGDTRSERRA